MMFMSTPFVIRGGPDGAGKWRSREGGRGERVYAIQHSEDTPEQVSLFLIVLTLLLGNII